MPDAPRLSLAVAFNGGVLRETLPGISKLANHLLTKGTERRDAETLARDLDEHAIDLHDLSLADCAILEAAFLPRELPVVLDILEDIILHSTFADFEKERTKLAGEIQASLDLPAEQAADLLTRTLFPHHPYGNSGMRYLEALESYSQEQVQAWYAAGLQPRQMNITLVGNFDPDELFPQIRDHFSGITGDDRAAVRVPVASLAENHIVTEARADANQAQVLQGWLAPPLGAPEQPAMAVMNTILGGAGLSSRLFVELRDKQGMAYSVRSQYTPMRQVGEFVMSIGTSPENVARARQGFTEQLTRMQDEPITPDELAYAKGRLRGSYVLSHETSNQRCLDMTSKQINGLCPNYGEIMLQRIEGVTVAEVQAAARSLPAHSVTAIVAPESALA